MKKSGKKSNKEMPLEKGGKQSASKWKEFLHKHSASDPKNKPIQGETHGTKKKSRTKEKKKIS